MYDQLYAWDNLLLAYRKAAKGKRGQPNVAAFEHALEDNLLQLQHELETQTYQPGTYCNFYIHDPKKRLISAAPFRDRVVHHALCHLIEPIFERCFHRDSYANRVGKGTHRALDRCQYYARRYKYVLQCDIQQFFPAIDHEILKTILQRKIPDERVNWLIARIIDSGRTVHFDDFHPTYFPGDDLLAILRPTGLPIGNLTSQFWANVYLDSLDQLIKRGLRCPGYVRYVDDFALFSDDKKKLWAWKKQLMSHLAGLRLTIHAGGAPKPVNEGIPFLGFIVFPDRRRLKSRKGISFRRKLKSLAHFYAVGDVTLGKIRDTIRGWVQYVSYGNTIGLRASVLERVIFHSFRRLEPAL